MKMICAVNVLKTIHTIPHIEYAVDLMKLLILIQGYVKLIQVLQIFVLQTNMSQMVYVVIVILIII